MRGSFLGLICTIVGFIAIAVDASDNIADITTSKSKPSVGNGSTEDTDSALEVMEKMNEQLKEIGKILNGEEATLNAQAASNNEEESDEEEKDEPEMEMLPKIIREKL